MVQLVKVSQLYSIVLSDTTLVKSLLSLPTWIFRISDTIQYLGPHPLSALISGWSPGDLEVKYSDVAHCTSLKSHTPMCKIISLMINLSHSLILCLTQDYVVYDWEDCPTSDMDQGIYTILWSLILCQHSVFII